MFCSHHTEKIRFQPIIVGKVGTSFLEVFHFGAGKRQQLENVMLPYKWCFALDGRRDAFWLVMCEGGFESRPTSGDLGGCSREMGQWITLQGSLHKRTSSPKSKQSCESYIPANEARTHPHCIDPLLIPAVNQASCRCDTSLRRRKKIIKGIIGKCEEP